MRRPAESVIAGGMILISGIYAYGLFQVQGREFTSNEIGPTTFPWVLLALLIFLSIGLFIEQWFEPPRPIKKIIAHSSTVGRRIIAAIFLIFLYVYTLQFIGFLWTTPVFIVCLSTVYDTRRTAFIAGMAVGITFLLYGILRILFNVLLP